MSGEIFFEATDSDDVSALWATNGTLAGTYEIGGAQNAGIANAYESGFGLQLFEGAATAGADVFFAAEDSGGGEGLWVSDGTASGTLEIGGLGDAATSGVGGYGLSPFGFVSIGGKVLFCGEGTNSTTTEAGLWVTDGTAAGTMEIGGANNRNIAGINASTAFAPTDMTSIGSKAVFVAMDSAGDNCLWVSNGALAGTFEIGGVADAGVSGAASSGLDPGSFFVLGDEAVFAGSDSLGDQALWVTNGTLGGTTEIGGLGNSGVSGSPAGLGAIQGAAISSVSGKIYFAAGGHLWTTNGTASGTVEIGGTNNSGVSNYAAAGASPNFVALNNGAIFNATDTGGGGGLWFTNGTAAGTIEIGGLDSAGVAGAGSDGLTIRAAASFGNDVIFSAYDSDNALGLWVTNGTLAGTYEIGGLKDAGVASVAASGFYALNFAIESDEVIFSGYDAADNDVLWATNGTTAGTFQITTATAASGATFPLIPNDLFSTFSGGAIYNGGGNVVAGAQLDTKTLYLNNTAGTFDTIAATGDAIYVDNAQASVSGGSDVLTLNGSSANFASLSNTNGAWDTVKGSNAVVGFTKAQAAVFGGAETVYLDGSNTDFASLYSTGGAWDVVYGSSGSVGLTQAQTAVYGGNDTVWLDGSNSDFASLSNTNSAWDWVNGSNGQVGLSKAQATVTGGGDIVWLDGSTSDFVGLYATNGAWDTVNGSNGSVGLTGAQARVAGGGDTIWFDGSNTDFASLANTGGAWDSLHGSNGSVGLSNAQATIFGGGDTVWLDGSASDFASLNGTGALADVVNGSNGVVGLTNAQASLSGSADTVYFSGADALSVSGASETFAFGAAIGQSTITGFTSGDTFQFSKVDFASWSLLQNDISQSGSNTVIKFDANDILTLVGVQPSNLSATQFKLV